MKQPVTGTHATHAHLCVKRVYDLAQPEDGLRVLVDRFWPRGLHKERAKVDLWLKEIAPSSELRRWFGHSPDRWEEFRRKYQNELRKKSALLRPLQEALNRDSTVTLLFAARDIDRNNAVVLKMVLDDSGLP